eukprot:366555_1
MTQCPIMYSLDHYNALWATQNCCKLWCVEPDTVSEKLGYNIKLQSDIEIRFIDDKEILSLYDQKGLFLTRAKSKNTEIIGICDGSYYTFEEWWKFGQKREENNVIELKHNGEQIIFEPLKWSEWKMINDCKNHQNKIEANCFFKIIDNNNLGIPIISVVALQNIKEGSQLFVAYGNQYWKAHKHWLIANKKR